VNQFKALTGACAIAVAPLSINQRNSRAVNRTRWSLEVAEDKFLAARAEALRLTGLNRLFTITVHDVYG
jgi:hypothetical protein